MNARRAVKAAKAIQDPESEANAHGLVDEAKRGLGERGSVWWTDGAPDFNTVQTAFFDELALIPCMGRLLHFDQVRRRISGLSKSLNADGCESCNDSCRSTILRERLGGPTPYPAAPVARCRD
jgi:hypothetical protein